MGSIYRRGNVFWIKYYRNGVAIRAGHHCAQPGLSRFGVPATARASLGVYTGRDDIDALLESIERAQEIFAGCQTCRNCTSS